MNLPERVEPWQPLVAIPMQVAGWSLMILSNSILLSLLSILCFLASMGYVLFAHTYNAFVGSVLRETIPATKTQDALRSWWRTPARLELAGDWTWALNDVEDFPDPDAAKTARNKYLATWECDVEELEASLWDNFEGKTVLPPATHSAPRKRAGVSGAKCEHCGDKTRCWYDTRNLAYLCSTCYSDARTDHEYEVDQLRRKVSTAYLTPPNYVGYHSASSYPPLPDRTRSWKCDCGWRNVTTNVSCFKCSTLYADTWEYAKKYKLTHYGPGESSRY